MTKVYFKDSLLDAQLLRAIGQAPFGGADIGECLHAAAGVVEKDLDSWYTEWRALGDRVRAVGEAAEANGQLGSARDAYLRACTYYRTSGVMLMGSPVDPRLVASNAQQTAMFRRAAALFDIPAEIIEIPYEGTTLPGYFLKASDQPGRHATLILNGGYDGSSEELYFYNGAAGLARGYNVLMFDGPGQGAALLQRGRKLRPDWEAVIPSVVDYAISRDDVDPGRIALVGLSLGGYQAPRAATGEHRLAAVVADSGSYDMFGNFLERIPKRLAAGFQAGSASSRLAVRLIVSRLARKPTAGWVFRRGMLVHGVPTPLAFVEALREYTLVGLAPKITCPTWVCHAEGDDIGASAPELFAALTVDDKQLVTFTAAEGADDHCEGGARMLYLARQYSWLDRILEPARLS